MNVYYKIEDNIKYINKSVWNNGVFGFFFFEIVFYGNVGVSWYKSYNKFVKGFDNKNNWKIDNVYLYF